MLHGRVISVGINKLYFICETWRLKLFLGIRVVSIQITDQIYWIKYSELKTISKLDFLIREVMFGRNESSQYLVVRSPSYITVWNLLTCSGTQCQPEQNLDTTTIHKIEETLKFSHHPKRHKRQQAQRPFWFSKQKKESKFVLLRVSQHCCLDVG